MSLLVFPLCVQADNRNWQDGNVQAIKIKVSHCKSPKRGPSGRTDSWFFSRPQSGGIKKKILRAWRINSCYGFILQPRSLQSRQMISSMQPWSFSDFDQELSTTLQQRTDVDECVPTVPGSVRGRQSALFPWSLSLLAHYFAGESSGGCSSAAFIGLSRNSQLGSAYLIRDREAQ